MIFSFFESLRFRGFLWPVALLRICFGWIFLSSFWGRWQAGFFSTPSSVHEIFQHSVSLPSGSWFANNVVALAESAPFLMIWIFFGSELVLGLSYFLGFLVRLISLFGTVLCLGYLTLASEPYQFQYELMLMFHVLFLLIGAGRCLGIDYHFYRHQRGIWW